MSSAILTVWRKELRDAVRDRRSVLAAMSYAFFGPVLMAVAFFFLVSQMTDDSDVKIDMQGTEHAPALVNFLAAAGIQQRDEPWPNGRQPIALEFPADWDAAIAAGEPARVVFNADFSNQQQRAEISRVTQALQNYSQQITQVRLLARGLHPQLMQPIDVVRQDSATKGSRAALLLGSVLVFILLSVFWSGMNVAIDISAGERERNSLEFLLSQPLSSTELVAGKTLTAASFAMFGAFLSLVIIPFVFAYVPLERIGISVDLAWQTLALMAVMLVPLALFATALQLFVSFRAKSFKEAQTYISFLLMVPMLASFGIEFARIKHQALYYLPLTGQHQAFLDMIKGEPLNVVAALASAVITLLCSGLLMLGIARMLRSEKVVFGL
ncbi:MAG: ABC transporter permease [Idiomarina sp.]